MSMEWERKRATDAEHGQKKSKKVAITMTAISLIKA